jgi:hypothetical protein
MSGNVSSDLIQLSSSLLIQSGYIQKTLLHFNQLGRILRSSFSENSKGEDKKRCGVLSNSDRPQE